MRRHFRSRRAPPWWPENEPWPPARSTNWQTWHAMRGRFVWRVGLLAFALFTAAVVACTTLSFLAYGVASPGRVPGGRWIPLPAFVLIVVMVFVSALIWRRVATPVGDIVEAAGRVAEGDYDAHVTERGTRDLRMLVRTFNSMVAQLKLNDQQRRNLLADVTHELRTPLTIIQGNLEGLLDGVYPRDDQHLMSILEETRVLSRLVDDLRTLALAESGALHLQKEPTDIGFLAGETVASFRPRAESGGIQLESKMSGDLNLEIDPARIRQVLENLLSNAMRYTPRGGSITVCCERTDEPKDSVSITVADTGAGIPADELAHVFDRFYKSRDSGGSGLGLAIAKNLVAAHGGTISAQSTLGHGSTFRVTLPRNHFG